MDIRYTVTVSIDMEKWGKRVGAEGMRGKNPVDDMMERASDVIKKTDFVTALEIGLAEQPKRRGRKPKDATTPKGKRGRPRKNPLPIASSAEVQEMTVTA